MILYYWYIFFFFFFFKQKTAYEMRISDWSSDVCSSDLIAVQLAGFRVLHSNLRGLRQARQQLVGGVRGKHHGVLDARPVFANRSEEHTSELQSLMRISYAVFCLKKKKQTKRTYITSTNSNNTLNLRIKYNP